MMSSDEFMQWSAVVRQAEREVEQRGVQWGDVPSLVTVGMWLYDEECEKTWYGAGQGFVTEQAGPTDALKETIVFTFLIPVLLWRSLVSKHVAVEDEE